MWRGNRVWDEEPHYFLSLWGFDHQRDIRSIMRFPNERDHLPYQILNWTAAKETPERYAAAYNRAADCAFNAWGHYDSALWALYVLGLKDKAEAHFDAAFNDAEGSSHDLLYVVDLAARLGRNESFILELLKNAQDAADGVRDWITLAEAWYVWGDEERFHTCRKKALDLNSDWVSDQILLDEHCHPIDENEKFFDQKRHFNLKGASGFKEIAVLWRFQKGDFHSVATLLSKGEVVCNSLLDWLDLAEGWMDALNDEEHCRVCLHNADEYVDNNDDLRFMAEKWLKLLDDNGNARRCLQLIRRRMAYNKFEATLEYAIDLEEILADPEGAATALKEAEEYVTKAAEHIRLAEGWHGIDNERARFHLTTAESKATYSDQWINMASLWSRLFHDQERADYCRSRGHRSE